MLTPLDDIDTLHHNIAKMSFCLKVKVVYQRIKPILKRISQVIHFLIVMSFLWAGLVEFINNPPFFDAYGDAISQNELPQGIFQNGPETQGGILRLMDIPILVLLLAYVAVVSWLRYEGLSWLLTTSLCISLLAFWAVNFWGEKVFDWKYYSTRMSGLELQVFTLALTGTVTLCVLFYKRKRLPFKFKSSVPIKSLGPVHLVYNFCCIFLIMFASMLMWFTKMYISWACFKDHDDLLQICQITNQVQCYPCHICSTQGIKECYKNQTLAKQFTCNVQFPKEAKRGSFCIFNYNMSVVGFLTIFAYIGGLCVFLGTFIRLVGHYILRVVFLLYELVLKFFNKSSSTLIKHREKLEVAKALKFARRVSLENSLCDDDSLREMLHPVANDSDIVDGGRNRSFSDISDSSYYGNNDFLDASCG